jgi:hypothetical protein
MGGGQVARPGTTWLVMLLVLCDRGEPPGTGAKRIAFDPGSFSRQRSRPQA